MTAIAVASFTRAISDMLTEVGQGPPNPKATWIVSNESGGGVLGTLDRLDAAAASRVPDGCKHSAAGHAGHVHFVLDLFNRAARGENPYSTAKWSESWNCDRVDAQQWDDLRERLRQRLADALDAVRRTERLEDQDMITGGVALVAHVAYHLGAIRQLAALAKA